MAIGNNDLIWPKKLLNADEKKNEPCDECCWLLGFVSIQQKWIPIKFSGRKKPRLFLRSLNDGRHRNS